MKYNYKPSGNELRSSLKLRSKEYFLENTLHGVTYIVDPTRPKWERITWFILTMASVAATICTIVIIWEKFQTEPIITGLDTLTDDVQIYFPQIFICYEWKQLNYSLLDKTDVYVYEKLYNWKWGEEINLLPSDATFARRDDFRGGFDQIGPDCGVLFNDCSFSGVKESCSRMFVKTTTAAGACCKFNASKTITVLDTPWIFTFATSIFPIKLYFMHKDDNGPKRDERPLIKAYSPVEVDFQMEVTYSSPDIRHLTRRQRQCHFDYEDLSLTSCEQTCLKKGIMKKCGCLPWFLSFPADNECPLSKYPCVENENIDIQKCKCTLGCDHMAHKPYRIMPITDTKKASKIKLSQWPKASYKRETRFGYLDLLVSFGGIAGLFLGYSLLTSIELGYYFTLRAYCGAVVDSSRKRQNIVKVQAVGPKLPAKLVVDPKYYQYID